MTPFYLILAIFITFGAFQIWLFTSREKRINRYIFKEFIKQDKDLVELNLAAPWDKGNPFPVIHPRIRIFSSNFMGMRGEETFYRKAVIQEMGIRKTYWVRVEAAFFFLKTMEVQEGRKK